VSSIDTKLVRADLNTWAKLRSAAYQRNVHIKTVLSDIMNGRIDPTKIEII
jgi:hypothetical protein